MKTSIIALAMFVFCAGAKAQTVTVADVEALPGETVAFTLNLTGGRVNAYTAMQFDAQFPVTGFSTTGSYSVSELWENAMAIIGSVNVDGIATIPVASSESISVSDVEGLLSVSFTVDGSVAVGSYDVTLKNLWFGYDTSSKDYLDDVTFTVHVVNSHRVVLDENSTSVPESVVGVNVKVKHTINAESWSTICLPFAMTEAQCKAAFGEDVQLADFSNWSSSKDNDGNVVGIEMGFTYVTEIEANHPYIIKVSSDMTEFFVDGVDIGAEEEPTVEVGKKEKDRGSFIGTYKANTVVPENNLFLSGNKFGYSAGATQLKGFSGYFELADMLTNPEEADERIVIRIGELLPGDVNGDGTVNGADIVAEINYVLADNIAGDVNGDGNVNGADIVAVINYVLNYPGGDARETLAQSRAAAAEESEEILSGTKTEEGISLSLTGGEDCTAFQFMLSLPEGVSLTAVIGSEERLGDHELLFRRQEDGRYLVLGFAMDNRCIGKSSSELLSLQLEGNANGRATVSEALIFTPQAETRRMNALDIDLPTAVSNVRAKGAAQEGDIYDLGGRKLSRKPSNGYYIRGGKKYRAQ